jgi:CheY-like chemotaxis protein
MTLGDRLRRGGGYIVEYAIDGEEEVEKATTLRFDLLVLDTMLRKGNGLIVLMCAAIFVWPGSSLPFRR